MAEGRITNQMRAHSHPLSDDRPKHSSGDLHSRLKTRKLLGVGETDDGDIHRSKLSQILGHSDQLYIKLPYGLRVWQLVMAVMFSTTGLWALLSPSFVHLSPSFAHLTPHDGKGDNPESLPGRLYGAALISLSIVYWMTLYCQDRDVIRTCLLSSLVYFTIQFVVSALSWSWLDSPVSTLLGSEALVAWRCVQTLGSLYFYVVLTRDLRHYR